MCLKCKKLIKCNRASTYKGIRINTDFVGGSKKLYYFVSKNEATILLWCTDCFEKEMSWSNKSFSGLGLIKKNKIEEFEDRLFELLNTYDLGL